MTEPSKRRKKRNIDSVRDRVKGKIPHASHQKRGGEKKACVMIRSYTEEGK